MNDTRYNHDRTTKQCTIFDTYSSAASDVSKTLIITTLEDCRGGECTYTTDPTVINNALTDFSGDASVKMDVSEDPSHNGLILTLTDSTEYPASTSRVYSNRIGCTERDEDGWVWYSRGDIKYI
jgi:hypothetical protein